MPKSELKYQKAIQLLEQSVFALKIPVQINFCEQKGEILKVFRCDQLETIGAGFSYRPPMSDDVFIVAKK